MAKKKAKVILSQRVILGALLVVGIPFFLLIFIPSFFITLALNPVYNMSEITTKIQVWQLLFGLLYLGIFTFVCWSMFCIGKIVYYLHKKKKLEVNKKKAVVFFVLAFLIFMIMSSLVPGQVSFLLDPEGTMEAEAPGPTHSLQYQNAVSEEAKISRIKIAMGSVGGWFFGTFMYLIAGLFYFGKLKTK